MGDEEFRQELLAQMKAKRGPEHFGAAVRESEMAKAERVVQKELKRLRWREKELAGQRKGDPEKVRLAILLRQNTTMTIAWIADLEAPLAVQERIHRPLIKRLRGAPAKQPVIGVEGQAGPGVIDAGLREVEVKRHKALLDQSHEIAA